MAHSLLTSRDQIKTFVPQAPPRMVILGTMASIKARQVDQLKGDSDPFFYHSPNNHFWTILQMVFEPNKKPQRFRSSKEKKDFLEKWQIAMANIVSEIKITKAQAQDPSDEVIFEAWKQGHVSFKKVSPRFKKILKDTPVFFTCAAKRQIIQLVEAYFKFNRIAANPNEHLQFLLTPTRCNPLERSLGWKVRMAQMGVKSQEVIIPRDFV